MGFFSWDCRGCGHPMLSQWAINETNGWMQDVAVIQSDGARLRGLYDGYGRVISHFYPNKPVEIKNATLHPGYQEPECWHAACWGLAGSPATYTEGSESSADQGFFFDDEHNIERPRSVMSDPKNQRAGMSKEERARDLLLRCIDVIEGLFDENCPWPEMSALLEEICQHLKEGEKE